MNVSLTDEEMSTICCGLLMDTHGRPKQRGQFERESALVWKLAGVKQDYDRMVAESTPLLLIERLNPRRWPKPSNHSAASTVDDASTVRPEAPTPSVDDSISERLGVIPHD